MSHQTSQQTAAISAPAAAFPSVESRPVLLTVKQFAARNPAFTPSALRNHIFKAEPRKSTLGEIPGNGLIEAGAIVRLGRRVLLNEARFLDWACGAARAKAAA